jgi:hypothetical protein
MLPIVECTKKKSSHIHLTVKNLLYKGFFLIFLRPEVRNLAGFLRGFFYIFFVFFEPF